MTNTIPVTNVLIVGAGPVGLTLACELHRWGVPFRIIDRKSGPEEHTKASSFWPRIQEITQAIGVGELLRNQGVTVYTQTVTAFGKLIGHTPTGPYPSPFSYVMNVSQGDIEHTLRDYLQDRGYIVEYDTAIGNVTQDADTVETTIEHANGEHETIHCRYLIAGDGSRSVVRGMVGLHIEPIPLGNTVLRQIDIKLQWSRPLTHDRIWFFLNDDGFCAIFPMPNGIHRVTILRDGQDIPERYPTLEEMQHDLRTFSGDMLTELTDPVWFSFGKFVYGVAERFREGRVFLVGDAGHITIPIGGQGMNTGIQDAFNLGWKLAGVLQGRLNEDVLDSYSAERHPIRSDLAGAQRANFGRLTNPGNFQKLITMWITPFLMRSGGQNVELGKRDESQLSVAYPDSPLSEDHLGRGGVKAGDRAPDAYVVTRADLATVRLFDLIYKQKWTLLLFENGQATYGDDLATLLSEIRAAFAAMQAWMIISTTPGTTAPRPDVLLDVERRAHEAYDIKRPTLLLIRPDGHVGFRGGLEHMAELQAYAQRIFREMPEKARYTGGLELAIH